MHPALQPVFDIIDAIVELYLRTLIRPFLEFHDVLYGGMNRFWRQKLDEWGSTKRGVPEWFTANFITYFRTFLIIPTLLMMSWGGWWWYVVSFMILFVDFGDFLDGVVARYWSDVNKAKAARKAEEDAKKDKPSAKVDSDDDSFEVVSIGRPQKIASWHTNSRSKSYGGFVDAVCDKVYMVPCWIFFLSTVPGSSYLRTVQYLVLWCLICAEAASGTVRFRAYFTAGGVPPPTVVGLDFSTSAVKADGIGKAKQTLEMVGSALYVLPFASYLGLLLLSAAVPLAYESVRRKIKKRVLYVDGTDAELSHRTLKFWMQARGMGSKLIIGVAGDKEGGEANKAQQDMVLNACACSAVDEVIAEAPKKVGMDFITEYGIDFVVCPQGKAGSVAEDDLIQERRCLAIGLDGTARPVETKAAAKTE